MKEEENFNFTVDYRIWDDHPRGPADIPAVYMYNPSEPEFDTNFRAKPIFPKRKDALMAAFIGNCGAKNNRSAMLKELMSLMPIHSYGSCFHNKDIPDDHPHPETVKERQREKQNIASQYFFMFSPENSNDVSYVSEKVYDGFAAGVIPVYYGASNIEKFIPAKESIVDLADFATMAEAAKYLIALAEDKEKYMTHMEWKKKEFSNEFKRVLRLASRTVQCRLAMALSGRDFERDLEHLEIQIPPK